MGTPLVSIVLTTFNRAALLARALESCLSQTYRNLEVLVVDDGSSDDTPNVVARFREADGRLRYLRMPANGGQSRALNAGFAETRGDLITWTSDDNRFKPSAIERMVEPLAHGSGIDLVFADFEDVTLDGQVLRRRSPIEWKYDGGFVSAGACFLYRRQVYGVVGGYDTRLRRCPDLDYWVRVQRRFRLHHLPEVLYENAVHVGMVSLSEIGAHNAEVGRVLARHARWTARPGILATWYERASIAEMKRGRRWAALYYAWAAALLQVSRFPAAAKRTYALSPPVIRRAYKFVRRPLHL